MLSWPSVSVGYAVLCCAMLCSGLRITNSRQELAINLIVFIRFHFISNFWSICALNCIFICPKLIQNMAKANKSPLFCYSCWFHLFLIISRLSVGTFCLQRLIGDYYSIVDRFWLLLANPLILDSFYSPYCYIRFLIPNSALLLPNRDLTEAIETRHQLQSSTEYVSVTQYEILLS